MAFNPRTRQSPFDTKGQSTGSGSQGLAPGGFTAAPAPDDFNFDSWDTPSQSQQQPQYSSGQSNSSWNQPQGNQGFGGVRPPTGGGVQPPAGAYGGVTAPSNDGGGQLYGNQIGGTQQSAYPKQPAKSAFPQRPAQSAFPQQQQQQQSAQPQMQSGQAMMQQLGSEMMGAAGVNPALMGTATMIGAQLINTEQAKQVQGMLSKYVPESLQGIQTYFKVTHVFVLNKFKFLFFPFRYIAAGSSGRGITDEQARPDLYVPLMAYITYILFYSLNKGVHQRFQPEILSSCATFGAVMLMLEVLAGSLGFFLVGTQNIAMLDLVSYSGYKYVPLVLWLSLCMVGACDSYGYYLFFVYFSACAAISLFVLLNRVEPAKTGMGQDLGMRNSSVMHWNVIIALTCAQVGLFWLLTPSLARSFDPSASRGIKTPAPMATDDPLLQEEPGY